MILIGNAKRLYDESQTQLSMGNFSAASRLAEKAMLERFRQEFNGMREYISWLKRSTGSAKSSE